MSLEKWVEYGWLRREPTSPGEIEDLLGIVDRSLADSKVEAVSTDLRFIAAFNARSASRRRGSAPQNETSFPLRITARLFRAQSVSGIGGGCAQSRERRSNKRQGQHETDACCVNDRIRGADSEHESADEPRDGERSKKTESAAGGRDFSTRAEHKPHDVAALCAQGHADGDLLRALRDAEGDDRVDAHGCEEQGGEREGGDEARIEAARSLHC